MTEQEVIGQVVGDVDACLQAPECTDARPAADLQETLAAVCAGVDPCLQSPECSDRA